MNTRGGRCYLPRRGEGDHLQIIAIANFTSQASKDPDHDAPEIAQPPAIASSERTTSTRHMQL